MVQCPKCRASYHDDKVQCPLCDTPNPKLVPPKPRLTKPLVDDGGGRSTEKQFATTLPHEPPVAKPAKVKNDKPPTPEKVTKPLTQAEAQPKAAILAEALQMAKMGCGGTLEELTARTKLAGTKPAGWQSGKWRGDTMPKSEMSAWCTHARKRAADAGFEVEDKKADGPTLLGLIEGFLAGLGFDTDGSPRQGAFDGE